MAVTTVYTYPLNSSTREFTVPFEYLARRFVTVTLLGTNRRELVLNDDYRFISQSIIQTTRSWGPGDGYERIEIRRNTSASERLVDFADGSILRAYELNISQVQTMHVAEEARNMVTDTIGVNNDGDLDARGRRIVNLADAVEPDHAVTLRQEQEWAESTLGHKLAAEAAQGVSEAASNTSSQKAADSATSAQTSLTQANRSKTEADRSAAQAVISKTQADRSVNAAATIGDNVTLAQQAATQSGTARNEAVTARNEARLARDDAQGAVGDVRSAAFQLGMLTWGFRASPWIGFAPDDGQELSRALYPEFAAALDSGLLPTVDAITWILNPKARGCFVAVSSPGKFRMRDLNGKFEGSLGAVFLRGDGKLAGAAGYIQEDELREHNHLSGLKYANAYSPAMGYDHLVDADLGPSGYTFASSSAAATARPYTSTTGGAETRPLNAAGCWMTRLFGEVTNPGSANAAQLATDYAALVGRMSALESRPVTVVSREYASADTAYTHGQLLSFQHGLGAIPKFVQLRIRCTAEWQGFAVGDILLLNNGYSGTSNAHGTVTTVSASAISVGIGTAGIGATLSKLNRGGPVTIPSENWRLQVRAYA